MNAKLFKPTLMALVLLTAGQLCMADDLFTSYQKAQAQDPALSAARLQRDAVAQRQAQATAALRPSVNLNANVNRQVGEASFNSAEYTSRSVRSTAWTLQLSQPLWRPALQVAHEQAHLQLQQAQEVLRQASTDLMLRVAQAYLDALVARESAAVADNQMRAVEQQLGLAQRNFEAGLSTVTDVHEARARFELARAQRTSAITEVDARNAELQRVLGYLPAQLARLQPQAQGPLPQPPLVQAWIDQAQAQSPQVVAQQWAVAIAAQEVRKASAAHSPSLDLTAGYGNNFTSGSMTSPTELASRSRATQVGLQLSLPLYAGGGTQSRVREASLLHDKALAELEVSTRQVAAQVRQAFTSLVNGQAQIEALTAAVAASKAAVDSNKIGYRIGTRINIDVLNAEQQLFATQRDLYRVRADTLLQTLRLKAASGTLDESDLQAVNALLKEDQ